VATRTGFQQAQHVGGFTRSPSAGVRHSGTFAGMIEKIPYLQALGITAVELLPVCEFDDSDASLNSAGELAVFSPPAEQSKFPSFHGFEKRSARMRLPGAVSSSVVYPLS
jgi:hypothetical protein